MQERIKNEENAKLQQEMKDETNKNNETEKQQIINKQNDDILPLRANRNYLMTKNVSIFV